jgi:hypothetical protein
MRRFAKLAYARRFGRTLAELFADFGADEVEKEDEVHEALNDEGELLVGIELEEEESGEKNDGG